MTAWIGQGVTIEGKISSAQDLHIDGRVSGAIEVGQYQLVLGEHAEVKANLTAKSMLISGAVTGDIVATERLQIQATGHVEGDVTTPRLIMHDGAILHGKVDVAGNARA
jgi:cytoskeletal protein CcmA (bactofilin family)